MRTEPGNYWDVTLTSGDVVRLLADGYSEDDGGYVFSVLADADESEPERLEVEGHTPSNPERVVVVVARIPVGAVANILTV